MRVISGRFKGVALATPKTGTRPTTDRTKEAIFSHLDSWGVLDDARVLDLFAGTGSWDASLKARVLVKKAEQVAGGFGEPFDVIFIDPPYAYETAECNQLLSDLAAGSATNENTVIMLERSVRSDDPTAPGGWQITESRNYGETAVFYIESADDDSDIERSDDSAA